MGRIDMVKDFRITGGKGFQMRFPNGYTVSIQMGAGNYRDDRFALDFGRDVHVGDKLFLSGDLIAAADGSNTVETAIIGPDGEFVKFRETDGDEVQGFMTSEDVAVLLVHVMSLPAKPKALPDPEGESVEGEVV